MNRVKKQRGISAALHWLFARMALLIVVAVMGLGCRAASALDVAKAGVSVLRIAVPCEKGSSLGSGFVIHAGEKGCIVATNCHVVAEWDRKTPILVVRKVEQAIEIRFAEILWADPDLDLAILGVKGIEAEALPLCSDEPPQGEDVYSMGFPGVADDEDSDSAFIHLCSTAIQQNKTGFITKPSTELIRAAELSLSKGAVRRIVTKAWAGRSKEFRMIEHDVNIGHGNSGGPLLNSAGQVVGINTAGHSDNGDKMALSSHISSLTQELQRLKVQFVSEHAPSGGSQAPAATPATPEKPEAPVAGNPRPDRGSSSQNEKSVFIGVGILAAMVVIGILVGTRGKKAPPETYTQYVRRTGAAVPPPPPAPLPAVGKPPVSPPQPPRGGCLLEGVNAEDHAQIRIPADEALFSANKGRLIIGRNAKMVHLCIRNTSISGQHATLSLQGGLYTLEDRKSSNGTRVNGQPLLPFQPRLLNDGDQIELGEVPVRFRKLC